MGAALIVSSDEDMVMVDFIENPAPEFRVSESWGKTPMLNCIRMIREEYWVETLVQHAFRLQKASEFLDPNDCVGFCHGVLPETSAREFLTGGCREISIPEEAVEKFQNCAAEFLNAQLRNRSFVDFSYWILCVSEEDRFDSTTELKSWNEYANNHTGVRFHFKFPRLDTRYIRVKDVAYKDSLPGQDISKITHSPICDQVYDAFYEQCIFTKIASEYSWEKEIRILVDDRATICNCQSVQILHKRESFNDNRHPYLIVPAEMISRVVFGCNTHIEDHEAIVTELRQSSQFGHIVFEREIMTSDGKSQYILL